MATITFPCTTCERRIGVMDSLRGQEVRCPHCKSVVVAPRASTMRVSATGSATPSSSWSGDSNGLAREVTPAPSFEHIPSYLAPGAYQPPEFKAHGNREGVESIFSDGGDDDESVFATGRHGEPMQLPDAPGVMQPTIEVEHSNEFLVASPNQTVATGAATARSQPQPAAVLAPQLPATRPSPAASHEKIDLFLVSPASLGLKPTEITNPWTKIEDIPKDQPIARAPVPMSATIPSTTTNFVFTPELKRRLVYVLAGYATLVTIVLFWSWIRGSHQEHPLTTIPDFFGQYRRADRSKVSRLPVEDAVLPPELTLALGSSLRVGDLQIEPLGVEFTKPVMVTQYAAAKTPETRHTATDASLVLRLRLTNHSTTLAFHPADPAYNRKTSPGEPLPLSGVQIGSQRFMGGQIGWPFDRLTPRIYFAGQEADDQPLQPGQSRETVLVSNNSKELWPTLTRTRDAIWRVHLRRGVTRFESEDVSVGVLFGVQFQLDQIQRNRS